MFLFFKKKTYKKHFIFFLFTKTRLKSINTIKLNQIYIGDSITEKYVLNSRYKQLWSNVLTPIHKSKQRVNFTLNNSFKKPLNTSFNLFFNNNKFKNNKFIFIFITKITTIFYKIINLINLKHIYSSSYGNYILFREINFLKKKIVFIFPSKKKLYTSLWVIGLTGRNILQLKKKIIFKNLTKKWRKLKQSVRGVAMNPIDCHNGGRSNRKPLFLNKYNNIAKHNK